MTTLAEIEAAAGTLSQDQQRSLLEWLTARMQNQVVKPAVPHSVLDISPVSVGKIIRLPGAGDDLLGEMLEERL